MYLSCFLILTPLHGLGFDCRLMNQYGGGVAGATVKITEAGKSPILDEIITNRWGEFYSTIESAVITENKLYSAYPNPSKGSSILPIQLKEASDIKLEVFNVRGEKVASKLISDLEAGLHQLVWTAIDKRGKKLPLGLYIIRMVSTDNTSSIKIALLEQDGSIAVPGDPANIDNKSWGNTRFDFYIQFPNGKYHLEENISLQETGVNTIYTTEILDMPFITEGNHIRIYRDEEYVPIFLKGINLGAAVPGSSPGELAASREEYAHWLQEMADAGLNYLRIYTLHFPRFYEELEKYNLANPENPIYLLQGIWLDEEYENDLIVGQTAKFDADIEEVIDCIHGNRVIGHRVGRAYGSYTTDVSAWLFGHIIGREIFPRETLLLELNYPDCTAYSGSSLSIEDALPIDVWMTGRLDHLATYHRNTYQTERPLSVSTWPTLDPITHPTEDPALQGEDEAIMDMSNINCHHAPAGFFISYHAYPYYPDFISEDPVYQTFSDSVGPNSYLGYLNDLKNYYHDIPLLIAEFGVPSSWGNGHFAFSGMHHGSFSEYEQGEIDVRLLNNIYDSGCAGGLLFSWIDEWFKNAWITEPFGSSTARRHFWHNVTSPEQNYGLLGFKEPDPVFSRWTESTGNGKLKSVKGDMDNAYFYAKILLASPLLAQDTLWVAFDTYRADLGESVLLNGQRINKRAEFLIAVNNSDVSPMFVTEAYNLYGIWHKTSSPSQLFHSIASDNSPWNPIRWKTNWYEWSYQEIGMLRTATEGDIFSSLDGVRFQGNAITIRIPWSLLQFTDPSRQEVMDDDKSTPKREVAITDGISLSISYKGELLETKRFTWDNWDHLDNLMDYEKTSYDVFIKGAAKVPDRPL